MSEKEDAIKDFKKAMKEVLKEHEFQLDDETVTRIKQAMKVTEKKETPKVEEQIEECEECGVGIRGKPKYCPGCGGELDWPE